MGKMIKMISFIIFVDILFITLWPGSTSLQGIIFNWVSNPTAFNTNFVTLVFQSLVGTIAVGALTAVVVALSGAKTDTVLFASFAGGTLYNIGKDFLFMFQEVSKVSAIFATLLIVPFIIMFAFITIEWLRGKD